MKKSIIKNISLGIACLLGVGGAIAAASILSNDKPFEVAQAADDIEYIYRYWNETNKEVVSTSDTCGSGTYTPVTSSTTNWTNGKWYVVNEDVTIASRVTVTGTVNLILCDGKTLTASQGIEVLTDNTLSIYGQSKDTGKIIATAPYQKTCIGGNNVSDGGSIIIQGGWIEANTHSDTNSTGIGGGYERGFDSITIYGGTVDATGSFNAPAIGSQLGSTSDSGTITIYGGKVDATGGGYDAGIGGMGVTVSITGGSVDATGGSSGAGIAGKTISISGGQINATGVDYGAGIGSGDGGTGSSVTISGGKVTATGGSSESHGIGRANVGGDPGTLEVIGLPVYGGKSSESLTIKTDYANSRWQYMKVGNFHTHNFISYSASGNVITATCNNADGNCPLTNNQATLTISAPSASLIYDGTAKEATYEDTSSGTAFSDITISYTKGGEAIVGSPIDAGTYVATISFSEDTTKTASTEYTIAKADASLTAPTAKTGLIYTGSAQELINAGSATGGTIWYKLGTDGTYTESIPTATDVGIYNVYYKLIGDDNHNDGSELGPIKVTISGGVASITSGTTVTYYADFSTALDNWDDGTILTLYKDLNLSFEISVSSGSKTFNLNGYTITGDGNNHTIFFVNGGTLTINGKNDVSGNMGTLCNGRGHYNGSYTKGGAIAIYNGGEVTINDCNIRDNECNYAGAVFVSAGTTATLNNCNVYNNITNNPDGYRGVIYVEGISAKAYINGGEIYGNSAGVYLFDGTANRSPCAKLNGVYIHDNLQYGVGIERNENGNPSLTIAGDTIIKNNSTQVTSGVRTNLRINGANNAKIAIDSTLGLGDNASIGITMTGDKGVFTNNTDVSLNDVSKFYSDDTNYAVGKNADGQLLLGTSVTATYEVVNGTWVGGSSDPINEKVASGGVPQNVPTGMIPDAGYNTGTWNNNPSSTINSDTTFTYTFGDYVASITNGGKVTCYTDFATALSKWTDGTTLTLYKDIVTSSTIEVDNTRTLDLNGYGFRAENTGFSIFNVASSGNLTINDSNPSYAHKVTLSNYIATGVSDGTGTTSVDADGTGTAYINGGYVAGGYNGMHGGAFYVSGGTLTLNGGTVIGNRCDYEYCDGGGIYLENKGNFTMNGGSIKYNYSGNSGAGIGTDNSTIEINGGVISYNRNNWAGGGAMSLYNSSSLKLYGGVIENNVSRHGEGAICFKSANQYFGIKGSPIVRNNTSIEGGYAVNLFLNSGVVAHIEGPLTEEADIHLYIYNAPGVITDGWSDHMEGKDPADYFVSDNPDYHDVYLKDGESYMGLLSPVASITDGTTVTVYNTFDDALAAWTNGTTLTLLDNVNLNSQITINDTKILDLNGYGIITTSTNNDSLFLINNGGNLTLNDSGDTIHYFFFDRYKGYDAGLATICDKAIYDTKSEDSRGTFSGGYITGLHITANEPVARGIFRVETGATLTMNGGTIIGNYSDNSASGVCSDGVFVMNGGNMIYNINRQGAINPRYGTLVINGGNISHNIGKNDKNIGRGGAILQYATVDCTIRGGTITNNVARQGAIASQCNIAIEGDPVIKDNIAVGEDGNSNDPMNILLCLEQESKLVFIGEFTGKYPIGVTVNMPSVRDITASTDVSFNNINNVVYDDPNYAVGQYPSDHAKNGQLFYAKLETMDVIDAIDNIGSLTYDGGKDDSLKDIITAVDGYNNLPQTDKDFVDEINTDILNHDVTTYKNVDKVGDLINAIPEPSPDKSYYDAITLAITEYNKLTEEELTLLNSTIDFEKILNDNIAARKVIIEIEEIGEVTYDGGINDSKKDIEKAEKSYDELSKDQKDIVDYVNHDVLVDDREIYDQMAKAIKAIKEIGKVENNEETKKKIEEARKIYDSLPEELKEFVKQYEDSLKVLEDDEKVLDVLVLIDDIGDVNYDSASQEKIEEARRLYDSLTEEQKRLIAPEALEKLEEKEAAYTSLNNTGNSLLVVFLIISGLLLILGLIVMYFIIRKKKEDNGDDNNDNSSNKSKTMKLASFTGLMPFIIYASHYLDSGYILLYIIIALTVIVWLTNLVLFILKKKGLLNKKKEEVKPVETVKESEPVKPVVIAKEPEPVNEEEEEETVTYTDEKGNIFNIRYIKSFTAKLIQSPEETKKYYEELKNYVLSYKKTTSRISWHYDSINSGRNQVLKFAIRGKTLCVYYPLNASDYEDSKYKVEAVESKKFEEVPCLYRIKNDRRFNYAKDLIDTVMANLGLVKGEEQHEVYSDLPYEENRPLILRGLIKEQKVQVNKPVEQVVSKKVNDDGDEIVTTKDAKGNIFEIRYIKSFTAKLSQASEEVKDYYNELKNYALSYKKANSRISWHFDSINVGRNQVIKFSIRGKTLCVYYALNANDYNDTKYKVEQVESKKYEEVPCLYRIKNDRRRDYAKDLIDTVMANVPTEKGKESNEDFRVPYESTKALLAKGLIKENKVQVNKIVEEVKPVEVVNEDEEEETVTYTDEKGNIFNIRYIKSFTAKLIQSPDETKKYYEELKNYVLSYKKTTSRISWHYDSVNSGRNQVLKFAIRGKTLCLYYPLNAEDYNDTKYKVEAVESKKFEEVPCLYRIKNDRRLGYAKDLIDTVMANLGLVKGEEQHEAYSNLPYEENRPLILRGLIKELKIQVNKPVEEPVVTKVEEVVIVKAEEVDNKMSDEEATSKISENVESKRHHGKKGIINIDVIARDFNNNDVVNIEALWKKKIISTNIGQVKVLARGSLDKKLHIELQDYSLQAVKMILLAGGTVKKVN